MSSVGAHDAKLFPTIPHLSIPRIDSYRRLPGRKSPLTNRGTEGRTPLLCQSNEVQPSSAFYSFPDLVFWVSLSLTLPLIFSSTLKKNCNYLVLKMKAFQGSLCALPIILQFNWKNNNINLRVINKICWLFTLMRYQTLSMSQYE